MRHVATSLIDTDAIHFLRIRLCRDRCVLGEHIAPFTFEIIERCDVLFPRFRVGRIEILILIIVVVFIGQTGKTMSEFMHDDRLESRMMRCGQCVSIVDATTTIGIRVGQNDDMFVGDTSQQVMYLEEPLSRKITVRIESREI